MISLGHLLGLGLLLTPPGARPEGPQPAPAEAEQPAPTGKPRPAARPPAPRIEPGSFEGGGSPVIPNRLDLKRQGDGSYVYVDPGGRFSAEFQPDGTVRMTDAWRRSSRGKGQRGKWPGLPPRGIRDLNPLIGIRANGPTEWVQLAYGFDPARSAKNQLLNDTRPMRIALAVSWSKQRIDERLESFNPELLDIWSNPDIELEERRRLLFERWDECDERFAVAPEGVPEEAVSEIDKYRLEAANEARRKVEAFVRRHAPRRGKNPGKAYTDEELDRLNANRLSTERFEPYTRRPAR